MSEELLTLLQHPSYHVRLVGVQRAADSVDEKIILALTERLYDWNPKVRLAASRALKGTQHPVALKALYEGARDADREFRRACLDAAPPITQAA